MVYFNGQLTPHMACMYATSRHMPAQHFPHLQRLQGLLHGITAPMHQSCSCLKLPNSFLLATTVQPSQVLYRLRHKLLARPSHEAGGGSLHQQLKDAELRPCSTAHVKMGPTRALAEHWTDPAVHCMPGVQAD